MNGTATGTIGRPGAAGPAGADGDWWADDAVTTNTPKCEFIFTGRRYDPETQLYFYRARYYLPELGRFASRDPAGYASGPNTYSYVLGESTIDTDPDGFGWLGWVKPFIENTLPGTAAPGKDWYEPPFYDYSWKTTKLEFKAFSIDEALKAAGLKDVLEKLYEKCEGPTDVGKEGTAIEMGNTKKTETTYVDKTSLLGSPPKKKYTRRVTRKRADIEVVWRRCKSRIVYSATLDRCEKQYYWEEELRYVFRQGFLLSETTEYREGTRYKVPRGGVV